MNIISLIKYAPKRALAILSMVTIAVIVPASLLAWGPDRPEYTIENEETGTVENLPSDSVFNSIINNPNYGDEFNFVTIKDAANQNAGGWVDDITVENDKEYYVRMYVHNNAKATLNKVAENVTAWFNVPTYNATRVQIDGYLSSTNATPKKIWDQAVFSGASNFNLSYVPGSATYTNNYFTDGKPVSDNVIDSGVKLGYDKYSDGSFDGNIPGCYEFSGLLIFKVKATTIDFSIAKTVRLTDSTDRVFKESVEAESGDKVDYQIYFKNTGGTQLKDVVIKDTLPAGMTYVNGTSKLYNSDGLKSIADGITDGGVVIGGYMPSGDAYLMFTAQVAASDELDCGVNTLTNIAKATTSNGTEEDGADVTVTKVCEETPVIPPVVPTVTPTVTPTTLPVTGASSNVAAFLGTGSLVTALGYYITSRRKSLVR